MNGLLKLPAVALAVARASAGQAFDATETAGNAVVGLQTPEAQAVHPPPEGDGAVIPPTTRRRGRLAPHLATPGTHLLPPQGTTHLIRAAPGGPTTCGLKLAVGMVGRGGSRGAGAQGQQGAEQEQPKQHGPAAPHPPPERPPERGLGRDLDRRNRRRGSWEGEEEVGQSQRRGRRWLRRPWGGLGGGGEGDRGGGGCRGVASASREQEVAILGLCMSLSDQFHGQIPL